MGALRQRSCSARAGAGCGCLSYSALRPKFLLGTHSCLSWMLEPLVAQAEGVARHAQLPIGARTPVIRRRSNDCCIRLPAYGPQEFFANPVFGLSLLEPYAALRA